MGIFPRSTHFLSEAFSRRSHNSALRTTYHSTAFLSSASQLKIAVVLLNVDHNRRDAPQSLQNVLLGQLWCRAEVRICADGAANRLHDSLGEHERSSMLPDLIRGDLDSLRSDVAQYYQARGVLVEHEPDQDSHDFDKCLSWLQRRQHEESAPFSVVVFGAFGGRLDQMMANINMVYRYRSFERFLLLSEHSLAFLLPPGRNIIEPNLNVENGSCGLIPLGGRCDHISSSGLRWNLNGNQSLEFGSLVSSSNEIASARVTVENSEPVLWTSNLRSCYTD
mmetsp:Transcript_4602/g.7777  ORF Transcript_4602/g.7777 Transcript_4602/m.7777 type:complete len:279 (-) Transcript_4602:246-1082(-)|eukprot:CAMPEP_0119336228 /NCGR_PEP_ID=MMETSP1333-20130426/91367_1 /TAXON_ID=418940 /ORGANISM="Scyphosphaera apsteinii, Strain RCC1455" /LENGTH=278 /DNA_ID=CAMNT_0007346985 /DNA_START=57 /DNA_END=893 /DNA_ORIENTATION=+